MNSAEIKKFIKIINEAQKTPEEKKEKYVREFHKLHERMVDFLNKLRKEGVSKTRFNNVENLLKDVEKTLSVLKSELENNIDFFENKNVFVEKKDMVHKKPKTMKKYKR